MEMHNLMEELVRSQLAEICREDAAGAGRYCSSEDCQTDAACYVLNRLPPRYVSSGRGLAHLSDELQRDRQLAVDITKLAHEALGRVTAVRRSYYDHDRVSGTSGASFNFPTIRGRILDGTGFMPVSGVEVSLLSGAELIPMSDERWSNPYEISDRTPGMYTFWPAPESADAAGEVTTRDFELRVQTPGFYDLTHHFTVELVSEDHADPAFGLDRDHQLPDLYLFRI